MKRQIMRSMLMSLTGLLLLAVGGLWLPGCDDYFEEPQTLEPRDDANVEPMGDPQPEPTDAPMPPMTDPPATPEAVPEAAPDAAPDDLSETNPDLDSADPASSAPEPGSATAP